MKWFNFILLEISNQKLRKGRYTSGGGEGVIIYHLGVGGGGAKDVSKDRKAFK